MVSVAGLRHNFPQLTVSGILLGINLVVFCITYWKSGEIFSPTISVLIEMGAKDPVRLAQGEIWRFFTPVFIHIGIVHFFFNSIGLYFIGPQIEFIFGRWRFLLLYLGAGICGNIFSSVFSLGISAGASGALFGLLGAGYYLERTIRKRVRETTGMVARKGAFGFLVIINVVFGLVVPGIDNAAHIGGLLFGIAVTMAMLRLGKNRLSQPKRKLGLNILLIVTVIMIAMGTLGTSREFVSARLETEADQADIPPLAYQYYSQAIEIAPSPSLYFKRGKLLAWAGELNNASKDLQIAAQDPKIEKKIYEFLHTYRQQGFDAESAIIEDAVFPNEI